jgi:hypothetical protein
MHAGATGPIRVEGRIPGRDGSGWCGSPLLHSTTMGKVVRCPECAKVYRDAEELEELRDNDSVCVICNAPIEVSDWDRILASWEDEEDLDDVDDDLDDWSEDEPAEEFEGEEGADEEGEPEVEGDEEGGKESDDEDEGEGDDEGDDPEE